MAQPFPKTEWHNGVPGPLINKIPVELLCRIFAELLHSPPLHPTLSFITSYRENMVLLEITAVCKRWRTATLQCATFWTKIVFSTTVLSTMQCAELFLNRSKKAMLSIHIWDSDSLPGDSEVEEVSKGLLQAISSQSHRILLCHLSSHSPNFWSSWLLPAPNLRNLVVDGCCAETPPAFCGNTPLLESLTSLYYTPWPLGNYPTLREAELRNSDIHATLATLLGALQGCKGLEKLSLRGYARLGRGMPNPIPIQLPRLFQINLTSCDSALILEYLCTPSLTGPVVINNANPCQNILQCLPNGNRVKPYLEGITELHVVLEMYLPRCYITGYRKGGKIAFCVEVQGVKRWARSPWIRSSIEAVASCVHFSAIHTLMFATDSTVVPWNKWLVNLRHLRNLRVSCPRSERVLSALLKISSEDGLPFCPSLHSFAIYECRRCPVIDRTGLVEFILHRYRVERPLRRLTLHKDTWEWIKQLDKAWVFLAGSQALDGEDICLEIPLSIDIEKLNDRLHTPRGRSGLVGEFSRSLPVSHKLHRE